MTRALFGAADKREVARRNVIRGKQIRATARASKSLQKRGMGTARLELRSTVRDEQRREAEHRIQAYVEANPSSPVAREWRDRDEEIDELRAAVRGKGGSSFLEDPGQDSRGPVHVKAYCVPAHERRIRVRVGS